MVHNNMPYQSQLKMKSFVHTVLLMSLGTLTACDKSKSIDVLEQEAARSNQAMIDQSENEGRSLTDIAGKATLPKQEQVLHQKHALADTAEVFVGRYQVTVDCKDPFVGCTNGSAEFVLNLLADGTAHRTYIHMGKVTYLSQTGYHQDRWSYDPKLNQIILLRGSGIQFYYDVDQEHNLTMNLDKIANFTPENKRYFAEGHPMPQFAYKLIRLP